MTHYTKGVWLSSTRVGNLFGYYNKELVAHWLSSINLGLVASGTCCMASMSRGGVYGSDVLLALLLCSYKVGDSG